MNPRIHNAAMKMGVEASCRPSRALPGGDATQGSAFGSTLG